MLVSSVGRESFGDMPPVIVQMLYLVRLVRRSSVDGGTPCVVVGSLELHVASNADW